jgi:ABC-type microcin C transport system permease subunit YejB
MLKKEHAHTGKVKNQRLNILFSHDFGVLTIDGFGLIGLSDTARDYNLQFTITYIHTLVSTVTSSLAVAR